MSDTTDEPHTGQGTVNPTQRPIDDINSAQLFYMFLNIEQRLPNFDHMLIAMNDYAYKRTSSRRQTNDMIEFCEIIKKGLFDWYTSSINNEINKEPNFMDLTNQVFKDDILMKVDKKLVSSTSDTNISKRKNTIANADNAVVIKSTSPNTDASESTNASDNTDASKSTDASNNTDASESTNAINADIGASESTKKSADTCKSTITSPNTCSHKSVNICTHKSVNKSINKSPYTCSYISASTSTNKRSRKNLNTYSKMVANMKHCYRHIESKSTLETLLPSTKTTIDTDHNFNIIMPCMTEVNTIARKRLPINHNIHFGNDYDRHWWRQTYDTIILNVDISDLVETDPNIKVVVTIIGFKIQIKRSNKWIVLISNKFEKAISKCKWVINKFMHVKLTINKRENEFWSKCLVTETRELDTSNFKNHLCSKKCSSPDKESRKLKNRPIKKENMESLTTYLQYEYGMKNHDEFIQGIDQSTVTNPPGTADKSKDSDTTLKLSVDPSTVKSLNSDSKGPPNTEPSSTDSEVPPNLAESSNPEVSQIQSEPCIDFESV